MHHQFSYDASGSVGVSEHVNPTALRFEYDGGGVIRHQIGSVHRIFIRHCTETRQKARFPEARSKAISLRYTSQPRAPPALRRAA